VKEQEWNNAVPAGRQGLMEYWINDKNHYSINPTVH
jgi:hypothetical protein